MNMELSRLDGSVWAERFCEYLRLLNRSERTLEAYSIDLRLFFEFLTDRGLTDVSDIGREDVNSYRLRLHDIRKKNGEPLAMRTQSNKLTAIFSFIRYLYQEQFILANPVRDMKLPKVPDSLPAELPTEEQVSELIETPDTSTSFGIRDRAILEILYSSALRNTELTNLGTDDVDLRRQEVRILCGKGQKGRVVPVGEPATVWIEAYLSKVRPRLVRDPNCESLFLNQWGRSLNRESLVKIVVTHARAVKMPMKVTPHILRHCCATHMLARGVGLRHLQQFLGHASSATTERYTRVEISDLREVFLRCHPREVS